MKNPPSPSEPSARNLPADPRERVAFCFAFGERYNGENFEEALAFARFSVMYSKGMKIGVFDPANDGAFL